MLLTASVGVAVPVLGGSGGLLHVADLARPAAKQRRGDVLAERVPADMGRGPRTGPG
ncbi:MAG: hypothetical protein R2789_10120 [Microthrixaceae bacterium]